MQSRPGVRIPHSPQTNNDTNILAAAVNNVKGDNGALKPILAEQGPVMLGKPGQKKGEASWRLDQRLHGSLRLWNPS